MSASDGSWALTAWLDAHAPPSTFQWLAPPVALANRLGSVTYTITPHAITVETVGAALAPGGGYVTQRIRETRK